MDVNHIQFLTVMRHSDLQRGSREPRFYYDVAVLIDGAHLFGDRKSPFSNLLWWPGRPVTGQKRDSVMAPIPLCRDVVKAQPTG